MSLPSAEAIEALFAEIKGLFDLPDKEWKLVGNENNATVFSRKYKDYSMRLVKMTGVIKHSAPLVSSTLFSLDQRPQWDTMCKSAREVKRVGEVQVFHLETPQIAIISPRDVVAFNVVRDDGAGGYLTVTKSLENSEKEVPFKKDVIRVDLILSGTKIESIIEDGVPATRITIISISDPKGMIPKLNVKSLLLKGTATIQALRDFLTKQQK